MKTFLKIAIGLILLVAILAAAGYAWASSATAQAFEQTVEVHDVDFPVPYPEAAPEAGPTADGEFATDGETGGTGNDVRAAAIQRGEHLVHARYGCADCHGENLGGGVMMDAMPMGRFLGPNLTGGAGSVVTGYGTADWDRAVRHGVAPDGRRLMMPAADFQRMSDQELSDIVAHIGSLPPVDNEVTAVALGPIGKMLVARGIWQFSADRIGDHDSPHVARPPTATASVEFGRHLAATCVGCHKQDYTGGDIGGDPNWAPAANLTAAGSLSQWTLEEFVRLMREGVRPDGSEVLEPMTFVMPAAQRMTDLELEAMYLFLRSLPARETAAS
ncbi:MAG: cytochrome c [Gemmatimonadetes bacterium]|nr:cytochrome c [Gemmatimonadota bacterium]